MVAKNEFILPVLVIERKLLTKCIKACSAALNESVQPWAVDTLNAVQVVKLVEDFLLSTGKSKHHSFVKLVSFLSYHNISRNMNTGLLGQCAIF